MRTAGHLRGDPVSLDALHREVYAAEASQYDAHRFSSDRGRRHNRYELRAIARLLHPLAGKAILDVPAGTARVSLDLQRRGSQVVAVDLTPEMLKVGILQADVASVTAPAWVNANARQLPFASQSFDAVVCIRFLHLLPPSEWACFLAELRRVSKRNGTVLVQLFNPLYGGPVALFRELVHRLRNEPREHFVWPHLIKRVFRSCGLEVVTISTYWLPGMGLVGESCSPFLDRVSDACARRPLRWLGGPFLVLARPC